MIITMPLDLPVAADCGWGQRSFDLLGGSETTGTEQVRPAGPARWTLTLRQPELLRASEAGRWQALLVSLRGRVNVLAAYNPIQTQPVGTLRGNLQLAAVHAAGATTLALSGGTASGTVRAGDQFQIGSGLGTSQTVMAMADGTASPGGVLSFAIEPPLRQGAPKFTPVTWDHPIVYFRRQGGSGVSWTYDKRGTAVRGMAIDLLETWS